ncbi:hypothetical protein Tco_0072106 [Tanacetum coccineum]
MQDCKPISTSFPTNVKLSSKMSPSNEKERMEMSRVPYASAVGSLMFLMICTRPDITHAVGVVSRYMAEPGRVHWDAVKRILRYIKGTSYVALCFRDSDLIVKGYVDSDYAVVAMSTTETEYVAAAQASKEAVWLKMLLEELGHKQEKITLFCDNQSALVGRTDFARVLVEVKAKKELRNKIEIDYVGKNENVIGIKEIEVITEEEIKAKYDAEQKRREESMANQKEGFTEVQNRRKFPPNQNKNWQQKVHNGNGNRQEYKKKNVTNGGQQVASTSKPQGEKGKEKQVDKMNRGTNQFNVLKEINASEEVELSVLKGKQLVDVYLRKKLQPTCVELWSMDINKYFKDQWELDRLKEQEEQGENVEDVRKNLNEIGQTMTEDNFMGFWLDGTITSGSERKELWKDLQRAKRISSGWPWLLTGDFNVTMKNEEHFNGGSKTFVKKKKSFGFANFITERDTFLPTVLAG